MVLGIVAKVAGLAIKKPKMAGALVIGFAILAFGVHYKLIVGERDKLRVAEEGYKAAQEAFLVREADFQEDLRRERLAAGIAVAERDEARLSVETFRNSRTDDESKEWAAGQIPVAELQRLCVALPEMEGC